MEFEISYLGRTKPSSIKLYAASSLVGFLCLGKFYYPDSITMGKKGRIKNENWWCHITAGKNDASGNCSYQGSGFPLTTFQLQNRFHFGFVVAFSWPAWWWQSLCECLHCCRHALELCVCSPHRRGDGLGRIMFWGREQLVNFCLLNISSFKTFHCSYSFHNYSINSVEYI